MTARQFCGVLAVVIVLAPPAVAQTPSPAFVFTQPFWLNLHHFLYVLGRVEAKMPDIQRRAVAGAPADEARGIQNLSADDRHVWREAVGSYASDFSRRDLVFDQTAIAATRALAKVDDTSPLDGVELPAGLAAALQRVAPIYRRVWWPEHSRANTAKIAELRPLLAAHQDALRAFVTRAYRESWFAAGYPINLSAYANWAGAYSTHGPLVVVSTLDSGNSGLFGLETLFHEAMHQWDDAIEARLRASAARQRIARVPDLLSHAMIFFTAGEAVRSAVPNHRPYADANGMWRAGRMSAFKPALDEVWKPYLDGRGSLDDALDALVKRVGSGL
jgi:hypothetical protein